MNDLTSKATTKVVILNSPPSGGKDVAAEYLEKTLTAEDFLVYHNSFKTRLNRIVCAIYGLDAVDWFGMCSREKKELPNKKLGGKSPREVMIEVSEKVIKPFYGKSFFGDAVASSLVYDLEVFSDGGFVEELQPVIEKVGAENVLVIRIHRQGCTFDNDSRSYLPDNIVPYMVDLDNDGTLKDYLKNVEDVVSDWLWGSTSAEFTSFEEEVKRVAKGIEFPLPVIGSHKDWLTSEKVPSEDAKVALEQAKKIREKYNELQKEVENY